MSNELMKAMLEMIEQVMDKHIERLSRNDIINSEEGGK